MHILSLMVTLLSGVDCPYLLFWDLDMDFAPLPLLIDILEVLQKLATGWPVANHQHLSGGWYVEKELATEMRLG